MFLPPITRLIAYVPAGLYELGVRSRLALYRRELLKPRRLEAPVVSVGNLTVGGTGKTPCAAYLARFLLGRGYDVAILSRGYKRASKGRIEVSNADEILRCPEEAGDEPYLLARSCPGARVIVDSDRYAAGRWIEQREPVSVFILDDGYQHLRLKRDLNLLLIDATEPLAGAAMVPFGRLREPLEQMRRADAILVTRSDRSFDRESLERTIGKYARPGTPVFYSHHEMTGLVNLKDDGAVDPNSFAGRPVAAVSGIARPAQFAADLERLGMKIVLRRDFEDHHRYTLKEFSETIQSALGSGAEAVVTTEKDAVNLPPEAIGSSKIPVFAARIEFRCENESELQELVLRLGTQRFQRAGFNE
jgi:tetraacyldisaccharide 4'-kinase